MKITKNLLRIHANIDKLCRYFHCGVHSHQNEAAKVELRAGDLIEISYSREKEATIKVLGRSQLKTFQFHINLGVTVIRKYQPPNRDFQKSEIQLVAREPLLDDTYDTKIRRNLLKQKLRELNLSRGGLSDDSNFR
ncbi:hypothetical protein AVEN_61076-1 [Araneus ventricosus]|uniref:Uncharacterized protein n=1 Tax=Araneus ventricosus TaxID=182803 RepID=A0A4Y2PYQ7_ARAVE|nr:hypothetical protein AVEN_61076-1 [Araneus ventricosus]